MNQLTELLQKLSEIEPEVCRRVKFDRYKIGEYEFGFYPSGTLYAMLDNDIVTGPPALAWLRDAVERAIITRFGVIFSEWSQVRDYRATVANATAASSDSAAHALLAAFVAAVGAVKEGEL